MHEYTVCSWYLAVVLAMYMPVSTFCDYRAFASLWDDELARTVGVLDDDGCKKRLNKHTHPAMWLKCQQIDGCFRQPHLNINHTKHSILRLDSAVRHRAEWDTCKNSNIVDGFIPQFSRSNNNEEERRKNSVVLGQHFCFSLLA